MVMFNSFPSIRSFLFGFLLIGCAGAIAIILLITREKSPSVRRTAELNAALPSLFQRRQEFKMKETAEESKPDFTVAPHQMFFVHISDLHIDPFFTPDETMAYKVCHSCSFSQAVHGKDAYCPKEIPDMASIASSVTMPFGRLLCNPPYRLLDSLFHGIRRLTGAHPPILVITGDIIPHGLPDEGFVPTADTKIEDLCQTRVVVMRQTLSRIRKAFPKTRIVYTPGNNDHWPKNVFWAPWMGLLGEILNEVGIIPKEHIKPFSETGCVRYDVKGYRFLAPDLTVLLPNSEADFADGPGDGKPTHNSKQMSKNTGKGKVKKHGSSRAAVLDWLQKELELAEKDKVPVYICGHQPMSTNNGQDQFVQGYHASQFRDLMFRFKNTIVAGLFGDRNVAGLVPLWDRLNIVPAIPAITVPGVSPRSLNFPAFHVVTVDRVSGVVDDVVQFRFDIVNENKKIQALLSGSHEKIGVAPNRAKTNDSHGEVQAADKVSSAKPVVTIASTYQGEWTHGHALNWRTLTQKPLTGPNILESAIQIASDSSLFFAEASFRKAGFLASETPENYLCKVRFDEAVEVADCLFPKHDKKCWSTRWLI